MATRFYLPSTGSSPITPTISTGWNGIGSVVTRPLPIVKTNTALANGTGRLKGSTTAPWNRLDRVFVSDQLAAQTLSGNHDVVMRGVESNAAFDAWLQTCLRVVSADGTVERGIAYALSTASAPSTATGSNTQELPTTTMATRLRWTLPMTSVAVQEGDRLQFEVGFRSSSTNTTYSATFRYGDPIAVADHAVGVQGVTTDLCPFFQTTMDLTFMSAAPAPTGSHFHTLAAA